MLELELALSLLMIASWIYWLIALRSATAFLKAQSNRRSETDPTFSPSVSVIKPVTEIHADSYENFVSFCRQDYPDFEVVFGVSEATHQAASVVKRLQDDFPELPIRLVVAPAAGVNRRAGLLHYLTGQATHDLLVVSDQDLHVTPDYLRRVVAPLSDPDVGLVTCPCRCEGPRSSTGYLRALQMNATFLPAIVTAQKVQDLRFATGATIALRRRDLLEFGGFAAVSDYLADEYHLAVRVAKLGLKVHLSDYVVTDAMGPTTFFEQWRREVGWARNFRITHPREYTYLLVTFCTPLAAALAFVSGFSPIARLCLAISLLIRWLIAWLILDYTENRRTWRWLIWLPLGDILGALVWIAGVAGRKVIWHGEKYIILSDGRLEPLRHCIWRRWTDWGCPQPVVLVVRLVDILLQRYYRIYEFSRSEECLLRLCTGMSDQEITLADGTHIEVGEPIGELHLWNEHIHPMPKNGPDLAWARTFQRRMTRSLRELAAHIQSNPELEGIRAFRGECHFGSGSESGMEIVTDLLNRWSFELRGRVRPSNLLGHIMNFWDNAYTFSLIWVFNPASLKSKSLFGLKREHIWISRETLLRKYCVRETTHAPARAERPRKVQGMDRPGEPQNSQAAPQGAWT